MQENEKIKFNKLEFLEKIAGSNNGVISRFQFEKIISNASDRPNIEILLNERQIFIADPEDEEVINNFDNYIAREITDKKERRFYSSNETIKSYTRFPRLTADEEREKANIYKTSLEAKKALAEFAKIKKKTDNDLKQIEELEYLVRKGERAREEIIYSYHPIVIKIALNYLRTGSCGNLTLEDLVQCGFDALWQKFEKFDFERANRFSTYAWFDVKNAIRKIVGDLRAAISINSTALNKRMYMMNQIKKYEDEYGIKPNDRDIAIMLGATTEKEIQSKIKWIHQLLENSIPTVNMDKELKETSKSVEPKTYGDYISDSSLNPEQIAVKDAMKTFLNNKIRTILTKKEQEIILSYFGLKDESESEVLRVIGDRLGLTKERIRQIKEEAIRKLRMDPDVNENGSVYFASLK